MFVPRPPDKSKEHHGQDFQLYRLLQWQVFECSMCGNGRSVCCIQCPFLDSWKTGLAVHSSCYLHRAFMCCCFYGVLNCLIKFYWLNLLAHSYPQSSPWHFLPLNEHRKPCIFRGVFGLWKWISNLACEVLFVEKITEYSTWV